MKNPLLRIQRISDWLDDRTATRAAQRLREKYAPLVEEARKQKNWEERDRLLAEWGFERDLVLDPVYARKAERVAANARKYGIAVPHQPTSYTEESEDWDLSNATGLWLLSDDTEQRLRREIRDEQRASYDELRKWATLGFAVLAFVLGLVSLLVKQKQPDPCPRNYYRDDAGQCVFALQKSTVQAKPQTALPEARPADARKSTHKPSAQERRGQAASKPQ